MATGPLLAHRLDMSTSGIILAAKTKDAHQKIQVQFVQRTIEKYYIAKLENYVEIGQDSGEINLPICPDYLDRPRQMVSTLRGKESKTIWKKINSKENLILFKPLSGRTHQLRVHAAHQDGLNAPIVGDELYGEAKDRLYLHAAQLEFIHPITNKQVQITCPPPFMDTTNIFPLSI